MSKITLGTKEWSDYSVNCINGCSNNCRYCYAKKMAVRFGRKTEESWEKMEIRESDVIKNYRKRPGRFMFPTSHDITSDSIVLETCLNVLQHILEPGNEVLLTTKPDFVVIKEICNRFKEFKDQIQFRFTITSENDDLLSFWEPGAPNFKNRLEALKLAYVNGFKTSISIEPFLSDPIRLIELFEDFVTESIWVGPMNYIKAQGISEDEKPYYDAIRKLVEPENLLEIYETLNDNSLVRLKDALLRKLIRADLISKNEFEEKICTIGKQAIIDYP